jgi:hypothetical protein
VGPRTGQDAVLKRRIPSPYRNSKTTPWSRDFLEKPIVSQLVKNSRLLCNRKFHYRVHKSPSIPRLCVTFCNKLFLYDEDFLTPHPTPKLESK